MTIKHLALFLALSLALLGCRRKKGEASGQNGNVSPPASTLQAPSDPVLAAAESARITAAVEAVKTGRSSPEQQSLLNQKLLEFEMRNGRPARGYEEIGQANPNAKASTARPSNK